MYASGFEGAVIIIIAIVIAIFFSGQLHGTNLMQKEAISRGYASYCPDTGDFAWNGECNLNTGHGE